MPRENMVFKSGMVVALVAEICIIWAIMFTALTEYDPTHIEAIGMGAVVLCAALASAVFLVLLFCTLKWKGQ